MLTILHASDLQTGRPYLPAAAHALRRLAETLSPDVVVVAGDLTQRAKAREYRTACSLLDGFGNVPVVVTPGNHDVPLWRVWERLATPFRNWRRYVSPELDTVTALDGATIVALNSAAPRRAIVGGRVDGSQIRFAREAFRAAARADARIVVVHHHLVPTPDGQGGRPLPGAAALAAAFEEMGVDLVLGGHVHRTHVTSTRDLLGATDRRPVPLVACGTTTSSRGRGPERGRNSLNVIRLRADRLEIVPHFLEGGRFAPEEAREFLRGAGAPVAEATP